MWGGLSQEGLGGVTAWELKWLPKSHEPGERLHFKEALRWRSGRGVPGALDGSGAGSEWVSKAG